MKCFYHQANDAIAICKSCNRALCQSCAIDVHPGTACIDRCEKDVADLNLIVERSKSAYQKTGSAYRRNGLAMLIVGLIFLGFGIFPIIINGEYRMIFMALLGVVFLLWSFFSYRSARQIETIEENA